MIYRIVLFRIKSGNPHNEARFREFFPLVREINYRYHCEEITILKGAGPDEYAYVSIWRDIDILYSMKQAHEYADFVDELLKYAEIVSDKVYFTEA